MLLYILLIAISVFIYLSKGADKPLTSKALGGYMLVLALFVGIADMLGGYDRYIYCQLFDDFASDLHKNDLVFSSSIYRLYGKEFGYIILNAIIALFTSNRYIFILIFTLIVYALVFYSMLKYTNRSPMVILLFMGLWFFFTFTYLRQVLAAATCWLAIDYVAQRKPLQFFAIVALAITIHNSAIVFTPLYFVPIKKFSPVTVILVMVACLAVGLTSLPAGLFEQYGEFTDMEKRVAGLEDFSSMDVRFEYLLEAVLFLVIIFWRYSDVDEEDERMVTLTNMALIFCAILLVFVRSDNGGRMGWHYMMGLIATLTNIANKEDRINYYNTGLAMLCAVLYLRIVVSWGVLLSPYKTFFSDGHREGDFIYEMYEYDERYDLDKMYR